MRDCELAPWPAVTAVEQVLELAACLDVHLGDVDGIGPPDVVLPGDALLKGLRKLVRRHGVCGILMNQSTISNNANG